MVLGHENWRVHLAHTVLQRMSQWLLRMNDLMNEGNIAVTQEMFSGMLGVQRTSVTLAAASLQKLRSIASA
jgi:hypothetical protein